MRGVTKAACLPLTRSFTPDQQLQAEEPATLQARALAAAEAKKQADTARRSSTVRGKWGSVIAAAKQQQLQEAANNAAQVQLQPLQGTLPAAGSSASVR